MKQRLTEEQIIRILRETEKTGVQIRELCRRHNVTEQTFFRKRGQIYFPGDSYCTSGFFDGLPRDRFSILLPSIVST